MTRPANHPWMADGGAPVILSAGRLSAQKDYPTLVKAFARVAETRPCRLIILGEGGRRRSLERLVSRLGLTKLVSLPGWMEKSVRVHVTRRAFRVVLAIRRSARSPGPGARVRLPLRQHRLSRRTRGSASGRAARTARSGWRPHTVGGSNGFRPGPTGAPANAARRRGWFRSRESDLGLRELAHFHHSGKRRPRSGVGGCVRTGLRPLPTWEILPGANEKPERLSAPGGSCLGPREGCVRRDDVSRPSTVREMRVARGAGETGNRFMGRLLGCARTGRAGARGRDKRRHDMRLRIASLMAGAFLVLALAASAQAKCGKVTISEMNWDSAAVAAQVEAIILNKGYGCQAELVPGDTVPTVTSMTEKGEPGRRAGNLDQLRARGGDEGDQGGTAEGSRRDPERRRRGRLVGTGLPREGKSGACHAARGHEAPGPVPGQGRPPARAVSTAVLRAGPARSSTPTCSRPTGSTRPISRCSIPGPEQAWPRPSPRLMSASSPSSPTTGRPPRSSASTRW